VVEIQSEFDEEAGEEEPEEVAPLEELEEKMKPKQC
jgi:hypothetical protein